MATPYQTVYSSFLSKITDYNLNAMSDTMLTSILRGYMGSAIVKFQNCQQDLTQRDEVNATFTITLSDDEVEILALYMVNEWYNVKLNSDNALDQVLTDSDFQIHSQQAHTQTTMNLRDANWKSIEKLVQKYIAKGTNFSSLSTNQTQISNAPDLPYMSNVIQNDGEG